VSRPAFLPLPAAPMGEGRGDGLFLGIFPVKQRVPSRSNPIPSRACPQAAPARTGLGHSIPSQNSSPVPIAVPFNRKCPDRTFVRRKSLQGQDYGRTPLSGPEGPNSGTDSEPRQSPDSCPVPTLDFGPWTLDSLNSVPARSRSQPIPVPTDPGPGPNQSRPNSIPSRSHQTIDRPTGAPLPLAERRLGAAQHRVPHSSLV
jgi:hypothetical protein